MVAGVFVNAFRWEMRTCWGRKRTFLGEHSSHIFLSVHCSFRRVVSSGCLPFPQFWRRTVAPPVRRRWSWDDSCASAETGMGYIQLRRLTERPKGFRMDGYSIVGLCGRFVRFHPGWSRDSTLNGTCIVGFVLLFNNFCIFFYFPQLDCKDPSSQRDKRMGGVTREVEWTCLKL